MIWPIFVPSFNLPNDDSFMMTTSKWKQAENFHMLWTFHVGHILESAKKKNLEEIQNAQYNVKKLKWQK